MAFSPGRTAPFSTLSAQYLQDNYLLGLEFVDEAGNAYPDSFYEQKISNAVSLFETHTQLTVLPTFFEGERHDYHQRDYAHFSLMETFHFPVLVGQYTPDGATVPTIWTAPNITADFGGTSVTIFPSQWLRLERTRGQIHMLPTSGTLGQVLMSMSGQYLPVFYGNFSYLPQLFSVSYWAGYDPSAVPLTFIDCIAKMAVIEILSVLANSVYPAGITSSSVGIDGLSTSRGIMAGPDTAPVFSGTIKQWKNDLYGMPSQGITGLLSEIYGYYRGTSLTVLG